MPSGTQSLLFLSYEIHQRWIYSNSPLVSFHMPGSNRLDTIGSQHRLRRISHPTFIYASITTCLQGRPTCIYASVDTPAIARFSTPLGSKYQDMLRIANSSLLIMQNFLFEAHLIALYDSDREATWHKMTCIMQTYRLLISWTLTTCELTECSVRIA